MSATTIKPSKQAFSVRDNGCGVFYLIHEGENIATFNSTEDGINNAEKRQQDSVRRALVPTACNEYAALMDIEMAARSLSDALRSGDTKMRLDARLKLDKAIVSLNTIRSRNQPAITRKPGGSGRPMEDGQQ